MLALLPSCSGSLRAFVGLSSGLLAVVRHTEALERAVEATAGGQVHDVIGGSGLSATDDAVRVGG
jgi:hypothetical protein